MKAAWRAPGDPEIVVARPPLEPRPRYGVLSEIVIEVT